MTRPELGRLALSLSLGSLLVACSSSDETLTGVSPARGTARGGEVVTLTGSGFGASPVVRFGDKTATIKSVSATHVEVTAPPGIAGAVDVEVTAGGKHAVLEQAFTYQALPLTLIDVAWARLPPLPVNGGAAAIADGNDDGHPDVFQAARSEGVWIYPNGGKAAFGKPRQIAVSGPAMGTPPMSTPVDVRSVVAADLDGDGKIDLFLGTTGATPSQVLLGDGKLGFTASAKALPALFGTEQRAIAVDIDGDGDLDLVTVGSAATATGTPGVAILLNDGHGKFKDVTAERLAEGTWNASGVAVGDVDGDGDVDLFFAADQEPCRLYLNDGHGTFQLAAPDALPSDPAPGAGMPALGDLDGDGSLDIYLPTATQDHVFFNDGTGHFTDLTDTRLGPDATGGVTATFLDLDLDGHLDVAVVDGAGRVRVYRNDGTGQLFDYSGEIAGDGTFPVGDVAVGDLDEDGVPDLFTSRPDLSRAGLLVNWSSVSLPDADGDGVPDSVDNCPSVPNADQADVYHLPFHCASATTCAAATGCELQVLAGSSYLFCKTTPATWTDAAAACTALGATLVTVAGADDNAFLVSLGAASTWIGYTDTAVAGTFVWASGSSSTYTNWGMGKPDTTSGDDCVALLADGTWSNMACTATLAYVCQEQRLEPRGPGDACDCSADGIMDGGAPGCDDGGTDGGTDGGADGGS
jgi:Lectin C-type domain/FG-GAP-like repeat/IPT/TIG domain/Thrombospondin type 3 repeat